MKKLLLLAMAIMVVGMMLFPACKAAPPEVTRWRLQLYTAAWDYRTDLVKEFAEKVWEQSNHRLKIELFLGGSLGYTGFEMASTVGTGMIESAWVTGGAVSREAPVIGVLELPWLFTLEESPAATEAAIPFIKEAADRINTVAIATSVLAINQLFAHVPVRTVEDWRGLKMRSWSPVLSDVLEVVGSSVVTIPYAEAYTAFATKLVEGNTSTFRSVITSKHYEVLPIVSLWDLMSVTMIIIVNKDAFYALPKDIQEVVVKNGAELGLLMHETEMAHYDEDRAWLEKHLQFVEVSREEIQRAADLVSPVVYSKWIKEAGPLGEEAIAAIKAALK